jgi:hypothetical protein
MEVLRVLLQVLLVRRQRDVQMALQCSCQTLLDGQCALNFVRLKRSLRLAEVQLQMRQRPEVHQEQGLPVVAEVVLAAVTVVGMHAAVVVPVMALVEE